MPHHNRIAFGSCSHPRLDQPLWRIVSSRRPAAFVWGGDSIYADRFEGLDWSEVGLRRVVVSPNDDDDDNNNNNASDVGVGGGGGGSWKFTFPPPSRHVEATPEILRDLYDEQYAVRDYREFVGGWHVSSSVEHDDDDDDRVVVNRPIIFGAIDDHDYGQNNGDVDYRHRRESNIAFVDFLYSGIDDDDNEDDCDDLSISRRRRGECAAGDDDDDSEEDVGPPTTDACEPHVPTEDDLTMDDRDGSPRNECADGRMTTTTRRTRRRRGRRKSADPMYRRALEGKGAYGVQLFDFSRDAGDVAPPSSSSSSSSPSRVLWGGGHWVPEEEAGIDPDVVRDGDERPEKNYEVNPNYSTTHSVAIFALDVRSNKTPWPKGRRRPDASASPASNDDDVGTPGTGVDDTPEFDFLGRHQWEWLRSALSNSRAAVNIIVSGMQVHPERFPNDGNVVEEWSKFPEARRMLYDTILNSGARGPILVSGDVHMAQILRKDCLRSSDVVVAAAAAAEPERRGPEHEAYRDRRTRPLVEVTTSGMTHSWGTSFSSQTKNHRLPLKPYAYFVSWTFMTICHLVCPWYDIFDRASDDPEAATTAAGGGGGGGSTGMQYYLGLNFAEFEFDFGDDDDDPRRHDRGGRDDGGGGALTVRIFGTEADGPPKLEMRFTLDQLTGTAVLPGMSARVPDDFLDALRRVMYSERGASTRLMAGEDEGWTCVPHRGLAPMYREYAANVVMFFAFCFLFFLPHGMVVLILIVARRRWLSWRKGNAC